MTTGRRGDKSGMRVVIISLMVALIAGPVWACVTLIMDIPPENQATAYTGSTSGTQEDRKFYKKPTVSTDPETDGLTVTVHLAGGTKAAPAIGSGRYRTDKWYITLWRGTKTGWATAPNANQSGNATMYIKKNRQVATCAPDWKGMPYHSNADGPGDCPTQQHSCCFDCSGLQHWLYDFVGYDVGDKTAQGYYNSSEHISEANLLPGDWIFLDSDYVPPHSNDIDHTMMYDHTDGDDWKVVIHASGSAGEVEEKTFTQWWEDHSNGLYGHMYGANERF